MAAVSTVPKLLRVAAIVGSLRKASINAGVARAFAAVAPEYGMEVVVIENDLPMFNSDLWTLNDRGDPSGPGAVDAAKAAVAAADAVAIISPEYNYGLPPVTANVIAWLSNRGNVLAGKPAMLMGAGGRMGTSRMQYHLRTTGVFLDLHILNKPEICINAFSGTVTAPVFDSEGNLVGEKELDVLRQGAASFARFARATIAGQKTVDAAEASA